MSYPQHCERCGFDWNSSTEFPAACKSCGSHEFDVPFGFRFTPRKEKKTVKRVKVEETELICPGCGESRQGKKTQLQSTKRLCETCWKNKGRNIINGISKK